MVTSKDGFEFSAIVYPFNQCNAIRVIDGMHSEDQYVRYIHAHGIEQADIIMPRLDFLKDCPTIKHIKISPSSADLVSFDYTPLYDHPEILSLHIINSYCVREGRELKNIPTIDYSRFPKLQSLSFTANSGSINFAEIPALKSLVVGGYCNQSRDLTGLFCSKELDTLRLNECKERSLDGIEVSENLQCLYISYNRLLEDIGALSKVKGTLKALRITNCPKIKDFSVLKTLEKLELLELSGSNELQDLSFISQMKNLKSFIFDVPVLDGDLTPCLSLSYAYCRKSRKGYNLADKHLPKGTFIKGNESIEQWRHLE